MRNLTAVFLLTAALCGAAERQVLFPADAKPIGPYSPGIQAGELVWVSGQGSRDHGTGKHPEAFADQVRKTVDNIRMILAAGKVSLNNVAYCQVYIDDWANYETTERVFLEEFKASPPARAVMGVAAMPGGTHVEITCVATVRAAAKRAIWPAGAKREGIPPAVQAGELVYVSGQGPGSAEGDLGAQTRSALDSLGAVLKAAGLGYPNMVFVNPYLVGREGTSQFNKEYATFFEFGNTPARATIHVTNLPGGARINFTGVAVRDVKKRRAVRPANMQPSPTASPCVFAGDVFYCSAKSGFVPGGGIQVPDVEGQLKQTMRNLLDGLEEAGLGWKDVVATNVYLDDLAEFERMNAGYKTYFAEGPPSRTTLQQVPSVGPARTAGGPGKYPTLEQISLIAVRP